MDWRVAGREEAWEAAAEAEAAAARRSGSGMRERVVGEGRSWGSPVGSGSEVGGGMISFIFFIFPRCDSVVSWRCRLGVSQVADV